MKNPLNSTTIWGIIAFLIGVLGQAIGMGPEAGEFLRDGFQVSDIIPLLEVIGAAAAALGLRNATAPLSFKAPVKLGFGSGKTGDKK